MNERKRMIREAEVYLEELKKRKREMEVSHE